jgi:hypothetical protein
MNRAPRCGARVRRYDRAPLIQPILFKTTVYRAVVFVARPARNGENYQLRSIWQSTIVEGFNGLRRNLEISDLQEEIVSTRQKNVRKAVENRHHCQGQSRRRLRSQAIFQKTMAGRQSPAESGSHTTLCWREIGFEPLVPPREKPASSVRLSSTAASCSA